MLVYWKQINTTFKINWSPKALSSLLGARYEAPTKVWRRKTPKTPQNNTQTKQTLPGSPKVKIQRKKEILQTEHPPSLLIPLRCVLKNICSKQLFPDLKWKGKKKSRKRYENKISLRLFKGGRNSSILFYAPDHRTLLEV